MSKKIEENNLQYTRKRNKLLKYSFYFLILTLVFLIICFIFRKQLAIFVSQTNIIEYLVETYYSDSSKTSLPTENSEKIEVQYNHHIAELDDRFLSVAIDMSQIVGGHWWSESGEIEGAHGLEKTKPFNFKREQLKILARELAPAYLRIGGSEADVIYYDMSESSIQNPPTPYEFVLNHSTFDDIVNFAKSVGYSLFFTINAGPSSRDKNKSWTTENAIRLLKYCSQNDYKIDVWELGNEINAFWTIHGISNQISGEQYAQDMAIFNKLIKNYYPTSKVAGPSCAFWPLIGEPLSSIFGVYEDFLKYGSEFVDIITWHYYPQQSRRCLAAVRRAKPKLLLNPNYLDEVSKWCTYVNKEKNKYIPDKEVWLGETGNAQCGGEPGISDSFEGGFWWLDELGLMAKMGQRVVIRQTLSGSNYGLINDQNLKPNPDYWNSLLWKRLMGKKVFGVKKSNNNPYIRVYSHSTPENSIFPKGSITLLIINVNYKSPAKVILEKTNAKNFTSFELTSSNISENTIKLNGKSLIFNSSDIPNLLGKKLNLVDNTIILKPASYIFLVFKPSKINEAE